MLGPLRSRPRRSSPGANAPPAPSTQPAALPVCGGNRSAGRGPRSAPAACPPRTSSRERHALATPGCLPCSARCWQSGSCHTRRTPLPAAQRLAVPKSVRCGYSAAHALPAAGAPPLARVCRGTLLCTAAPVSRTPPTLEQAQLLSEH